jgi:hypothetical protein
LPPGITLKVGPVSVRVWEVYKNKFIWIPRSLNATGGVSGAIYPPNRDTQDMIALVVYATERQETSAEEADQKVITEQNRAAFSLTCNGSVYNAQLITGEFPAAWPRMFVGFPVPKAQEPAGCIVKFPNGESIDITPWIGEYRP